MKIRVQILLAFGESDNHSLRQRIAIGDQVFEEGTWIGDVLDMFGYATHRDYFVRQNSDGSLDVRDIHDCRDETGREERISK